MLRLAFPLPPTAFLCAFLCLVYTTRCLGERHISTSAAHTCAVAQDLSISCVGGENSFGQNTKMQGPFHGVSVGDTFTCGLYTNGSAVCWGLLAGITNYSVGPLQSAASPSPSFLDLAAGPSHVCGLQSNGTVLCFGEREVVSSAPLAYSTFQAVSSGSNFSCGVLRDGSLSCWGGAFSQTLVNPTPIGMDYAEVAAGAAHACALRWNGSVVCWGDGSGGATTPPPLSAALVWITSGINFTCGIYQTNDLICWGAPPPPLSPLLAGVRLVEATCWSTCARVTTGGVVPTQFSTIPMPYANPYGSPGNGELYVIAANADGRKLVTLQGGHYLFTSTDYGATWTQRGTTVRRAACLSSSADGSVLAAAGSYWGGAGFMQMSWDSGATWTPTGPELKWSSVASSSNGRRLAATDSGTPSASYVGYIYTSVDSGASWQPAASPLQPWTGVACSSDEKRYSPFRLLELLFRALTGALLLRKRRRHRSIGPPSRHRRMGSISLLPLGWGGFTYRRTAGWAGLK